MTKLYLDINTKEKAMKKDYVAEIMQKWYDVMSKNNTQVQPKTSTMLGTILAEYNITPKEPVTDIWQQALTIKGGDFPAWYDGLTATQKDEYNKARKAASEKYDPREKQLLKG